MRSDHLLKTRRSIAFLLCGFVSMIIAAASVSDTSQRNTPPWFMKSPDAVKVAEKLQRLALELLGEKRLKEELERDFDILEPPPANRGLLEGKLREGSKVKAAREYLSAFPDTRESFHRMFGYGSVETCEFDGGDFRYTDGDVAYEGALYWDSHFYIDLYFELFNYADKQDFIRRVADFTIGACWRGNDGTEAIYEYHLWHHFTTHLDDYLKHLSHDKEAVIALLRFFTLNEHMDTMDHSFHHAIVPWGVGELCLSYSRAMRLCAATGLIDVPLLDDIVAVLECDEGGDTDCVRIAGGSAFQTKLARWAKDNFRMLDAAFEPCSKNTMNYLPMFYMIKRYLADEFRVLPLLEAKLYINHPKLSMKWLDSHRRDFEMAKSLSDNLFFNPSCKGRDNRPEVAFAREARRVSKTLTSRYKEYLTVGEVAANSNFNKISANAYTMDSALFANRYNAKELLKHWEEAVSLSTLPDPYDYCR